MTVCRAHQDRIIAGVCGGLAEHLGWSSRKLRIVWFLATLLTAFGGVVVYMILWYLMPKKVFTFDRPLLQPWRHAG
jgi:phage shock protein C